MRSAIRPFSAFPDPADWPAPAASCEALLPIRSRAWMLARSSLVPAEAIRLFCVDGQGATAALLPVLRHDGWLHELPRLFEPGDLVWSSPDSLDALAGMLVRQPLPLRLERVPEDSPSLAALRRAFRWRGMIRTRQAMPTPVIDFASHGDDPDACLTPRRRADLRRAARRAERLGTVRYELHAPRTSGELEALMQEAMGVEARSWKEEAGTALTADPSQGDFFEVFTRAAMDEGMLRIALLRIDGRAVAMQIACEWNRRYWLFKISHDQAYADCSPGQLLLGHTLRQAAREGLLAYEFLGLMASWTEQWTRQQRRYLEVEAIPFSAHVLGRWAKNLLRSALARIRKFLR